MRLSKRYQERLIEFTEYLGREREQLQQAAEEERLHDPLLADVRTPEGLRRLMEYVELELQLSEEEIGPVEDCLVCGHPHFFPRDANYIPCSTCGCDPP